MNIPATGKKKALLIVDVEPAFLKPRARHVVPEILKLIEKVPYDAYVAATFHAEKGSLWDIQNDWTCPKGPETELDARIAAALKGHPTLHVEKESKSIFNGDEDVAKFLKEKGIEEVHIVGLDSDCCVAASTTDAFDLGFASYVIEECTDSSTSQELHNASLVLLRHQRSTNNSLMVHVPVTVI